LKRRHHFLTFANEVTLESAGYSFSGHNTLVAAQENRPYITAVRASAHAVLRERSRILKARGLKWPAPFDLILTCPSFYRHIYTARLRSEALPEPVAMLVKA